MKQALPAKETRNPSVQREIIGTLANRRTHTFSRMWRHWSEIFSPTYLDRGQQMKKATIRIRRYTQTALKEMCERFVKAWKTGKSDGDLLQFESPAALFRVLTAKRWNLIERLQTTGPTTLRGLARELDRDVKRVYEDVSMLIKHGLVVRTGDRKICVPYDVIHADFDLRAVA